MDDLRTSAESRSGAWTAVGRIAPHPGDSATVAELRGVTYREALAEFDPADVAEAEARAVEAFRTLRDASDRQRLARIMVLGVLRARRDEAAEDARRSDPQWQLEHAERRRIAIAEQLIAGGWAAPRVESFTIAGVPEPYRQELMDWVDMRPLPGMIMLGGVGVGKSGAMLEAARLLLERDDRATACRVHYDDLVYALRRDDVRDSDAYGRWRTSSLLAIDDLGVGGQRPAWIMSAFETLIDARQEAGLATAATSNAASLGALTAALGSPCISRLRDRGSAIVMTWAGGRDRRLGGAR